MQTYHPTLYLLSGHIQTFLLEFINLVISLGKDVLKIYKFHYEREIFNLSDSGQVAVDHCITSSHTKNKEHILLVVPGFTSESSDYYIKSFVDSFVEDFDVRVINMRGIGIKLATPKMISWDSYKDLEEYIINISKENPHKKIYCVGFSFGGMLLARYLGTNPDAIPKNFIAGAGVCYPPHMGITANNVETNYGGIYSKFSARNLKKIFFENLDVIFNEKLCNKSLLLQKEKIIEEIRKAKVVSEFDNAYTVKFLEMDHVQDYYEKSDLDTYFPRISKPFLSVFTVDDPIVPFETVPLKTMENNKNMVTVVNNNGGHLAFFSGLIPERWISQPVKTFMKTANYLVENHDHNEII
jgi:predicted alpha/beta-fold hydrolase